MTDGRNDRHNRNDRYGRQRMDLKELKEFKFVPAKIPTITVPASTLGPVKPKIYRMAAGLWVIQYKFSTGLEVVECRSSWTDCIDSLLVEIDMRAALRHVEGMGY